MTDRKPPRLAAAERETLHALLQFQRDSLIRKLEGADAAAAGRSPVGSGTTLLWLARHLARVELLWLAVRFAGQDTQLPEDTVRPGDTVASAVAAYRAASAQADAIAAGAGLDELCRAPDTEQPVSLRWVLAHLLEETARHAGHADILRELIDGSTGR